uniref:Uncharacterized protein n=1 Tax=Rhizophora mucronata TaxID=61149 RepID=A0A2P2PS32_RHIMU
MESPRTVPLERGASQTLLSGPIKKLSHATRLEQVKLSLSIKTSITSNCTFQVNLFLQTAGTKRPNWLS